jgi:hypothetical protein
MYPPIGDRSMERDEHNTDPIEASKPPTRATCEKAFWETSHSPKNILSSIK